MVSRKLLVFMNEKARDKPFYFFFGGGGLRKREHDGTSDCGKKNE